jgi:hypothetical protein
MFNGEKKEQEVFLKAYVEKVRLDNVQVHPKPEDLENWIEVDFDPDFKYRGKIYDIALGAFIVNDESLRKINRFKRKQAYRERSDPLYIEWQFDQTPEAEKAWRDEVKAIKAEFKVN